MKYGFFSVALASALAIGAVADWNRAFAEGPPPRPPEAPTPPTMDPSQTLPGMWMVKETAEYEVDGEKCNFPKRKTGQVETYQWIINLSGGKFAVEKKPAGLTYDRVSAHPLGLGVYWSTAGFAQHLDLKWDGAKLVGVGLHKEDACVWYVRVIAAKMM